MSTLQKLHVRKIELEAGLRTATAADDREALQRELTRVEIALDLLGPAVVPADRLGRNPAIGPA